MQRLVTTKVWWLGSHSEAAQSGNSAKKQAVEHFVGMVKGLVDMERRLLQRRPDHDQCTKIRIEGAVKLFLNGCRAR